MKGKKAFCLKICLMALILLNMKYGILSFDSPRLNYLVIGFALTLPWFMSPRIFDSKAPQLFNVFVVYSLRVFSVLSLIIWSFFAFIYTGAIIHNTDYSFEKIKDIKIKNNHYAVYRTNGGAMTSFGIVVRKEFYILPFLKYSSVVYEKYPASELIRYGENNGQLVFIAK